MLPQGPKPRAATYGEGPVKLEDWLRLLPHPVWSRLLVTDFDAYDAGLGAIEWSLRWRLLRIGYDDDGDGVIESRMVLLLGNTAAQMDSFVEGTCK
jgi:hypothetical protein